MLAFDFIKELSKLRPSATILTVHGYRNEYSEVADYQVIFHISYENALKKSLETLRAMDLKEPLELQARRELTSSFNESLRKGASSPALEDRDPTFVYFDDRQGNVIKGIKMHQKTGELYLYGLVLQKRIRMPGYYPAKTRRLLTVAKDKLRSQTPVGKFRMFKIRPDQLDRISVENRTLLPPG